MLRYAFVSTHDVMLRYAFVTTAARHDVMLRYAFVTTARHDVRYATHSSLLQDMICDATLRIRLYS